MPALCALTSRNVLRSLLVLQLAAKGPMPQSSQQRNYTATPAARSSFTYRIGAAAAAKQTYPRNPKAGRDFWSYASTQQGLNPPYLRSSKRDSGEDAFFATTVGGSANHVAFGLADGVGGWQDQGIDPSDFSHGLCGLMAGTAYTHEGGDADAALKPKYLLQTAYDAVQGNPRILAGGSTASLAVANAGGAMEAANLGDSGFLILGPNKVAFRSPVQTHAFNTPWQMAKVPPKMRAQHAIFGGSQHFSEIPEQADETQHQLRHGDLVLFATDGVWDNLSAQDVLVIVTRVMMENKYWFTNHSTPGAEIRLNEKLLREMPRDLNEADQDKYLPGLLATAVMREAKVAGLDRRRDGPFAKEVNMRYPQEGWQGGKPDDIAVVVCIAIEEETKLPKEAPIKAKL